MNCCENSGNKESKESPEGICCSNRPEMKISWFGVIIAIILTGLLFLSLIAM